MSKYNTNLAAEFYVLSMLHRLGIDASLTIGNKKAVDILVVDNKNEIITIDVKGLAGAYDWPADNINQLDDKHHYYVLLSFEGKISDYHCTPSVWVIPSTDLAGFLKKYKTRTVVSRALVKSEGTKFLNAWKLLSLDSDR